MKSILLTLLIIISYVHLKAQVGIGTTTPHSSAILEVKSTTKGFLPPRLTIGQRNSIGQPTPGLLIYNKSLSCIETFNGMYWFNHCCTKKVNLGLDNVTENTVIELEFEDASNLMDHSGNTITPNGFIKTINSVEGNNYSITEVHNSDATEGALNDTIFKYIVSNTDKPPYTAKHFLRRTRVNAGTGYGSSNYLSVDVPDIVNNDFEIFIVARFTQSGAQGSYESIFHTRKWGPQYTEIAESFQISSGHIANNTSNQYIFRYGPVNGYTNVLIDDKFHVFNVKYTTADTKITVYLDGEEVYTGNDPLTVKQLSFFTNRNADSSPKSEIGSFVLYDSILSEDSRKTVSEFLICKYGDL